MEWLFSQFCFKHSLSVLVHYCTYHMGSSLSVLIFYEISRIDKFMKFQGRNLKGAFLAKKVQNKSSTATIMVTH